MITTNKSQETKTRLSNLLTRAKDLSINNQKDISGIGLKLSEETGEVSQAILSYNKESGSNYKNLGASEIKEESIDTLIVALSLFYKLSEDDNELLDIMESKLSKWESVK